jgi:hypothetical protein
MASLGCLLQAQAAPALAWSQGTYIWDSRALLNPRSRTGELDQLQALGLQDLLVGLSGDQVRRGRETEEKLRALLQSAHGRGLRVSLLLGDPSWIEPAGRPGLIALIERFRTLPFQGLHLDLEVEQLGWPVPAQRLNAWLNTLQRVKEVSPWPISLSSHPRWFETTQESAAAAGMVCVPCRLEGISSINLMIYQRQPQRLTERSLAIARRWPRLRFRLAQSVEAQLSKQESWHGSSAQDLQRQAERWKQELGPAGLSGVDWQDWAQYPKGN